MLCGDCPQLDATRVRAMQPDWQPRAVCCCDEAKGVNPADDQNAAMSAAAVRGTAGQRANLTNRRQRRKAEAQARRRK